MYIMNRILYNYIYCVHFTYLESYIATIEIMLIISKNKCLLSTHRLAYAKTTLASDKKKERKKDNAKVLQSNSVQTRGAHLV